VTSRDLIAEAEQRGAHFSVNGSRLEARPRGVFDPQLAEEIGKHKPEIIDVLQRREKARASEWRVDHDVFTVDHEAKSDGELAACLACGGTWELHGCPPRQNWRIIANEEAVELVASRFVVARAKAILEKCDRQ
jgi:hypothetical protein